MTGCDVKLTLATAHRSKLEKAALLDYILQTALFENYSKNSFLWISKENPTISLTAPARARKVITTMKQRN